MTITITALQCPNFKCVCPFALNHVWTVSAGASLIQLSRLLSDGVVTKQEQSANFWDCSDPYITVQVYLCLFCQSGEATQRGACGSDLKVKQGTQTGCVMQGMD